MIISHEHKFIFIKTQKTAGTSIEIALSQYCGPLDVITSETKEDEQLRKELGYRGAQNFNISYPPFYHLRKFLHKKFGFKRVKFIHGKHARASFIREYVGEEIWNSYYKFCFERNPFDRAISAYYWYTRKMEEPPEINDYILALPEKLLSNWSFYTINNEIVVDYLGRYETLKQDLENLSTRLDLSITNLPRTKTGTRKDNRHYSQLINSQARTHIERICEKEIEALNYHWEGFKEI